MDEVDYKLRNMKKLKLMEISVALILTSLLIKNIVYNKKGELDCGEGILPTKIGLFVFETFLLIYMLGMISRVYKRFSNEKDFRCFSFPFRFVNIVAICTPVPVIVLNEISQDCRLQNIVTAVDFLFLIIVAILLNLAFKRIVKVLKESQKLTEIRDEKKKNQKNFLEYSKERRKVEKEIERRRGVVKTIEEQIRLVGGQVDKKEIKLGESIL